MLSGDLISYLEALAPESRSSDIRYNTRFRYSPQCEGASQSSLFTNATNPRGCDIGDEALCSVTEEDSDGFRYLRFSTR